MVKNNLKALLLHLIIVGATAILLVIFVATGPAIGKYTTNIAIRVPLSIVIITAYIYSGMLLDINNNKRYDFLAGSIISIIGIGLWLYAFLSTGKILYNLPKEVSQYWIYFNFYYTPFTMLYFLLNIKATPVSAMFTNLFPSLVIGCGLAYKRLVAKRKYINE